MPAHVIAAAAIGGTVVIGICVCVLLYFTFRSKKKPYAYESSEPSRASVSSQVIQVSESTKNTNENANTNNPSVRKRTRSPRQATESEIRVCVVCKKRSLYIVLPCKHKCFCSDCAKISMKKYNAVCPVAGCETPIVSYIIRINKEDSANSPGTLSPKQIEIKEKYIDKGICVKCKTEKIQFVCMPCGHHCLCIECLDYYEPPDTRFCPFCQTPINKFVTLLK